MSEPLLALWWEKFQAARQHRIEVAERWLKDLEAFLGDDATLMRIRREQTENAAQLSEVGEALSDEPLSNL